MQFRILIVLSILIISCKSRYAGMIPMHMDEFITTTEERAFELQQRMTGTLINFQPSYDCTNDTIAFNSTSIIKLVNGDTITVYSPCEQNPFELGTTLLIEPLQVNGRVMQKNKREIIQQFPKRHPNHPYWECISCKYPNTEGMIIKK